MIRAAQNRIISYVSMPIPKIWAAPPAYGDNNNDSLIFSQHHPVNLMIRAAQNSCVSMPIPKIWAAPPA